jgi:lipoprotein-anchoring transpeptidase ErfK/SrfK
LSGAALAVVVMLASMVSGVAIATAATGSASVESTGTTVTPAPTPAPPVDKRPIAPKFVPKKGKAIYLDRRKQRIYLYVDGRQIDTFLCSTSRTLPRRGTYYYKFKRPASSAGSVTFKWQTVFTKGPHGGNIGFHTIPVNSRGHEIAPVGKPVSHGCVRCPKKKAYFIYKWITKKTPIIVRP